MTIGNRIKERRIELGLSADDLADRIGKSRATVYRYENGDIENMPTTVLEPLAKALETTPADLMGWESDESLCEMTIFQDEIEDYLQELGEFLYYNTNHKVLFDSIMEVKTKDIELARQMLDRINGKYSDKVVSIEDARAEYMNADAANAIQNASTEAKKHDEDIMDDDNF